MQASQAFKNQSLRKSPFPLPAIILLVTLAGCDPHYLITISNTTNDTVEVLLIENNNFRTEKEKFMYQNGFNLYKLQPKEQMKVGSAIAEIDNDILFDAIKIIKKHDTTFANQADDIKNLFDKTTFKKLVTPYNISIR